MLRTYKYRLYPNKHQGQTLDHLLETHRTVYNDALHERREAWMRCGISVSYGTQAAQIKDVRAFDPDVALCNYSSLQHTMRRLDKAFRAFFRRVKAGQKAGYPRFRGKSRFDSFEYTYGDGCKLRESDGRIRLYVQNVGELRIKYHRPIPDDAKIKHLVIKRRLDKWYACFQMEMPEPESAPHGGPAVGVDVGLLHLLALSDGTFVENPRWLRESQRALRVAQRRLARRKKGSQRRRRAARQVANLHDKIANQRCDFWHKTTRELVNAYSLIAIEDLPLGFMTHNHHLALSAHDASLGMFRQMIEYKAEEAGTRIVAVNPNGTSQVCSKCGSVVRKALSVRLHLCPECGIVIDRDVNAAMNVLQRARTEPLGHKVDGCVMPALRSFPL